MSAEGHLDGALFRQTFSYGVRGKYGYGDLFDEYCKLTKDLNCKVVLTDLEIFTLKLKFMQRQVKKFKCYTCQLCFVVRQNVSSRVPLWQAAGHAAVVQAGHGSK